VAHWWEQWWLIGWEQWWLIGGSSGGSLVATPDYKLQSWVQIQQSPQPTVDCQSLDGQPSGMALCCRLSSEGRQRRIYLKKHQKQLRKKKNFQRLVRPSQHERACSWCYLLLSFMNVHAPGITCSILHDRECSLCYLHYPSQTCNSLCYLHYPL
jgi:hypothetical protein